jgi:hypothetical protein
MISKGNIFHTKVELDNAKRLSGTQKVKFDIDFLGCVECSIDCPYKKLYTGPYTSMY